MEAGNEAGAVNLASAGCRVAKPDYVGAALAEGGSKGKLFGAVGGRSLPDATDAVGRH